MSKNKAYKKRQNQQRKQRKKEKQNLDAYFNETVARKIDKAVARLDINNKDNAEKIRELQTPPTRDFFYKTHKIDKNADIDTQKQLIDKLTSTEYSSLVGGRFDKVSEVLWDPEKTKEIMRYIKGETVNGEDMEQMLYEIQRTHDVDRTIEFYDNLYELMKNLGLQEELDEWWGDEFYGDSK